MKAHTKQQQDKVFETDFIDSQKSEPPFAHLLALNYSHDNLCFRDSFAAGEGRQPCRPYTTRYTLIMTATTATAASFSVREATERDCDEIIRMVKVSHGRVFWVWGFGFGFLCICLSCYSEIPGTD